MKSETRNKPYRFSCFIIGEGTLPIRCAEVLADRGHTILGAISSDAAIERWATEREIPCVDPRADVIAFVSQRPFEYLFSIVNSHILPQEMLRLPDKHAINYHNALLPKYGGSNAASWALMNRETVHGVTWHVVTDLVDGGDILKQHAFEIAEGDTALTLNAKCYEAALRSFSELADDLACGRESRKTQNLKERTFFPLYKRPPAGCVFSWNHCADDIDSVIRALDTGPYPNPLGCAKFVVDGDFVIVCQSEVMDSVSEAPPGTITGIDSESLRISTSSREIVLHKLLSIDGQPLSIPDIVRRFGLQEGHRFNDIDSDLAGRITAFNASICKHEAFWVARLATVQPLELPDTHRNSSPAMPSRYARVPVLIADDVRSYIARCHPACNPGDFLIAAFAIYFARICGASRFDLSYTRAELRRSLAGMEGLFAAHVPLRLEIDTALDFIAAFHAVEEQLLETRQHLTYARDAMTRYPALRSVEPEALRMLPVVVEQVARLDDYEATPGSECTLAISEDGAECLWVYDADVADLDSVTRMVGHVRTLLQGIVSHPERRLSALPILPEADRRQLLVEWNDTRRDYSEDKCLHELFEAQVEQTPDAAAVVFEDRQMTYRQLNETANQVGWGLTAKGIGKGSYVPILMDRGGEVVIAMLAIMKTGAAFVPLDIHWPADRIKRVLADLNCGVILVHRTSPFAEEDVNRSLFIVDGQTADTPMPNLNIQMAAGEPLYAIYTSGSTGVPKAAVVPHRGITNRFFWMNECFGGQTAAAVLQTTPHLYDSAVWQIFWPLINGGKTVIPSPGLEASAHHLSILIDRHAVTMTDFVPSVLNTIVPELVTNSTLQRRLRSLRSLIVGGEEITPSTTYAFMSHFPQVRVVNLYGPTEASIGCICYEVTGQERGKIPIGKPISNVQVVILDRDMNPVPGGMAGELYLAGVCLGLGYLKDEQKTKAAFVDNPFAEIDGRRLYKTGDRARYLPDGNIEFLGRLDAQVKIRGFRIELTEIETVLAQHPSVREAVVVACESGLADKRLVAYVVSNQEPAPSVKDLRTFLKTQLPDYMVPWAFVTLAALPLTPNGKVDRRALPLPQQTPAASAEAFVAPRTDIETRVAQIWGQVLGLDAVGIHDSFFDLGGHSLLATQVISQVRHAFEVEVPLHTLFEVETVAGLARRVETQRRSGRGVDAPPVVPVSRDGDLPLSFAQQRLWFLDQLEPGSCLYNLPKAIRLRGSLNVEALQEALNAVVVRHEILRTNTHMAAVDGDPVQVIRESRPVTLDVIDVSQRSGDHAEIARLLNAEAQRPFDLSSGLMLRASLVKLGENDHVLLVAMHHIASDRWSMGILSRELSKLYDAFSRGAPDPLPVLPIQYADYAVWQRHWLRGDVLERQLFYWKEQLAGIATLELPTDRPRPAMPSYRGATQSLVFPQGIADQLRAFSRKEGVTLFMTLLAAFQTLLHRYCGQVDIGVGSPIAGRTRPEVEGLMGFFVNTLVLRTDLSGNPSFRELTARVRRVALDAYEHQDLPFERIVAELNPHRDLGRNQLFQVMFAFDAESDETVTLSGLEVSPVEVTTGSSKFDLTLSIAEVAGSLTTSLEYNCDLFEDTSIGRMLGHFQTVLQSIIADPEQRLSDVPILTDAEKHQLLVAWNATQREAPPASCIHELFEAQVASTPDAVAVVFEDQQLTYRDLNAKANQVAYALRTRGVGPEVLVGICMERSVEMVVGLLGILKAGGAYVPLDPAYPRDRLALMLDDAQVPVLLSQQPVLPLLPDHHTEVWCLDRDGEGLAAQATENPPPQATPDALAYVIYTSGSTGRPKGVQIPHGAVVNLLRSMQRVPGLRAHDTLLAVTTLSFDIAGLELFLPLIVGARVVLASREVQADGHQLADLLAVSGATVMQATPATWRMLLDSGWPGHPQLTILCGGEELPRELADRLLARSAALWNMYGPTETTIWSAIHHVSADSPAVSIGRPIDNTQIYILDAQFHPVPIGIPGELYIGGQGVGRGYVNRPELTAERFLPDPFSPDARARVYKTGDIARYRADGNIDLLGRVDHQVKIRGFRIELGEIESVLLQHADVQQAVVLAREDTPHDKRLVAYIISRTARAPSTRELLDFLQHRLPNYMVPAAFVPLAALPLTPNGKVNRRALPAPDPATGDWKEGFVAPRNLLEYQVAEIWKRILGVERIGVSDNFFDLGGHSLLAVRVISQIERIIGTRLSVIALFQAPTIEQLARLLRHEAADSLSSLVPLQSVGSRTPFFWIHGDSSDALLPRLLGPDQPLFGLMHQSLDGTPALYTSVEEIATHYLREIRTVRPKGPYRLGGYCFGGMVAFEVAQQLQRQNERVDLVVLVNPSSPRSDELPLTLSENAGGSQQTGKSFRDGTSFRDELSRHLQNMKALRFSQLSNYVLQRVKGKAVHSSLKIIRPVQKLAISVCLRLGRPLPPSLRSRYILEIYFKAIRRYVPERYSGRLTIFQADVESAAPLRWKALARGGADVHYIPGDHLSVLEESHIRPWAETLKNSLMTQPDKGDAQ